MNGGPSRYHRVLLKLSGAALQGTSHNSVIDQETLNYIAEQLKSVHSRGVQVGVAVGGGNILRGEQVSLAGIGRWKLAPRSCSWRKMGWMASIPRIRCSTHRRCDTTALVLWTLFRRASG